MSSPLIKRYGKEKRWVNYRLEKIKDDKITKIPYYSKTKKASSTDPKTWRTYDECAEAFDNGANKFDGIGIVLYDKKLICIDIDHVVEDGKVFHPQAEKILDLLKTAKSFTEISQSGTGLHIFIECEEEFVPLANKKAPFEIYSDGRYIATTNKAYGKALPLRTLSTKEILQTLQTIGYPWGKETAQAETSNESASATKGYFTDEELVEKMFKSKNGADIKKLFNGDASAYKDDKSVADMALLSHLAFWSGKDGKQMERIWMSSPLGDRKKTKDREDYRVRSIGNAIAKCKEVYTPSQSVTVLKENPDLELLYQHDSKGNKIYTLNTENIARVLRGQASFAGRFRFDSFKNTMEILDDKKGLWRNLIDADTIAIQTKIQILFPFFGKVGSQMVEDAIMHVCRENSFDSAIEYVQNLKWDGEARLDLWLSKVYGVPEDEYHKSIASNWMKGLISRILYPGSKFDYVLVLEGPQGTKKSTSLSVLGQIGSYNWHTETTSSTESKDFFMQFQGKAIIEFSEGETLSRTEVKRMKAIITTASDRYRPSYGRIAEDFPRRCVFAMTTNQSEYLKDETGNRRWLPVACLKEADIDWLKENRDQLFAEAYMRLVTKKEKTYEFPEEEMKKAQASRRIADPNTEAIMDWYINKAPTQQKDDGVSVQDVYSGVFLGNFSSNPKGIDRAKEMVIANVLVDELQLVKKRTSLRGVQAWRYFDEKKLWRKKTDIEELMEMPMPTVEEMRDRRAF